VAARLPALRNAKVAPVLTVGHATAATVGNNSLFDVLALDSRDLGQRLWEDRREALVGVLGRIDHGIHLSEHLDRHGPALFRAACGMGLEGVVSKRRDRPYRSRRSADCVKVKNPIAPAAVRIFEFG